MTERNVGRGGDGIPQKNRARNLVDRTILRLNRLSYTGMFLGAATSALALRSFDTLNLNFVYMASLGIPIASSVYAEHAKDSVARDFNKVKMENNPEKKDEYKALRERLNQPLNNIFGHGMSAGVLMPLTVRYGFHPDVLYAAGLAGTVAINQRAGKFKNQIKNEAERIEPSTS